VCAVEACCRCACVGTSEGRAGRAENRERERGAASGRPRSPLHRLTDAGESSLKPGAHARHSTLCALCLSHTMQLATIPQQPLDDASPPPDVPLLACVPAPTGATRLAFSWGLGPRLLLTPLGGGGAGRRGQAHDPPAASVVQW